MAGQFYQLPTSSVTATNPSVGVNGSPAPLDSTQMGATDGTNLQPLRVDGNGYLETNVKASVLPTGRQLRQIKQLKSQL